MTSPTKPAPTEFIAAAQPVELVVLDTPIQSLPAVVPSEPKAALPDPREGGNYVRDPVTGKLSINPAFITPQE